MTTTMHSVYASLLNAPTLPVLPQGSWANSQTRLYQNVYKANPPLQFFGQFYPQDYNDDSSLRVSYQDHVKTRTALDSLASPNTPFDVSFPASEENIVVWYYTQHRRNQLMLSMIEKAKREVAVDSQYYTSLSARQAFLLETNIGIMQRFKRPQPEMSQPGPKSNEQPTAPANPPAPQNVGGSSTASIRGTRAPQASGGFARPSRGRAGLMDDFLEGRLSASESLSRAKKTGGPASPQKQRHERQYAPYKQRESPPTAGPSRSSEDAPPIHGQDSNPLFADTIPTIDAFSTFGPLELGPSPLHLDITEATTFDAPMPPVSPLRPDYFLSGYMLPGEEGALDASYTPFDSFELEDEINSRTQPWDFEAIVSNFTGTLSDAFGQVIYPTEDIPVTEKAMEFESSEAQGSSSCAAFNQSASRAIGRRDSQTSLF